METQTAGTRQPVLFLPHGGGPCFFMDQPEWDGMADYLRSIAPGLPQRPAGIVVVSGHWETKVPTVTTSPVPSLLFDYYGFPEHTYHLKYPAPGSPALAARVRGLLDAAGISSAEDAERGLDHGVFVPFLVAFPEADIPVVELSLQENLSPGEHLRIGQALESLRDENILIVTTGMNFHNLRLFWSQDQRVTEAAQQFDDWLAGAAEASPAVRDEKLRHWEEAPAARLCHPREEHLLPLMVAAGAAGQDLGVRDYSEEVLGKAMSGIRFG
ncbi:dioxygenase [Acetobacter sp. AN02]|uniref:DODA-type extradiol aromatic ring-opening family dioxygenase n=1 Tax=Acetobacter sp. AN02 TaxID=2894186 RepID=UPI0024342DAC|nr:class III extradiol ring-cleavage dioxygenase [Acetobacter sp. AN02]MDG6094349.1 dioxygenase [Acetobacter sp. AN02]